MTEPDDLRRSLDDLAASIDVGDLDIQAVTLAAVNSGAGSILIDGSDIAGVPPEKRPVNTVFQSYALYPNMNVAQNIAFGLEMRKVPKPEREAAVQRVFKTAIDRQKLEPLLAEFRILREIAHDT